MQLRAKFGILVLVGGSAAFAIGGVPALASGQSAKSITGPEVAAGAVHGKASLANAPTIPLQWQGLVNTHSSITLGGSGPHNGAFKTLSSPAGNLTVQVTAKPQQTQSFSSKTCLFQYAEYIVLEAVGSKSTGAFAGASGPGAVKVHFAAYVPRYTSGPHKGQCNTSKNVKPLAKGAVGSFLLSTVLTLK